MPNSPSTTPPLHLAVIPDGNRRWANAHKLQSVWKGHERAVENFRTLTDWCRNDPRIGILTVWCFSTENWKRDPKEVEMLMDLLEKYLRKEGEGLVKEKTRFVHSGRRDRIPPSLSKLIEKTEQLTKDQTEFTLHLAVDYGGKDEILRAISRLQAGKPETRNQPFEALMDPQAQNGKPENLQPYLDHPELPDIDLIFRSSGEQRTSNFFLWQSTYAEWIFSPKLFPDVGPEDLAEAVTEFERRQRRFGN
ncbi:MAG: polyprenyl diphosphate synthase [Candidatus Peribacteraceae bacterium]|nr:polyprenyl diphosphate synthase [Candidatus Peribacteraceae bacterium]